MLEYTVEAEQVVPNVSTARAEAPPIFFDSSPGQSEHLLNQPELLLSAFQRLLAQECGAAGAHSALQLHACGDARHGVREDKPPRLVSIDWELTLWTDEPQSRIDLLERNLRKQGTIYNTLAAACAMEGRVIPLSPATNPAAQIAAMKSRGDA